MDVDNQKKNYSLTNLLSFCTELNLTIKMVFRLVACFALLAAVCGKNLFFSPIYLIRQ